jgi:hypothetical protein
MTRPRKIFVLAAPGLRSALVEQFRRFPEFAIAAGGIEEAAGHAPELVLLDAEAEPAASLRARFGGPILLICGASGGARPPLPEAPAEYVERPFRFADLLARIRARLRLLDAAAEDRLAFGRRLRLTEKESAILNRLALAGGEAVAREILLRDVWGYHPAVTTRTLETHICRLRRKIAEDPSAGLLVTEKTGYRLIDRAHAPAREC